MSFLQLGAEGEFRGILNNASGSLLFSHYAMSDSFATPMDCSPSGSSVNGISRQELELVAISFPRGSLRHRDQTHVYCIEGGFFTSEPPGKH